MFNQSMARKYVSGELINVSAKKSTGEGLYQLDEFVEDKDYADVVTEEWIWSIGRELETGRIFASTDTRFYGNPRFECLFLR